ncbi:MAG: hypothetical protein KDA96_24710 [Planctomycetaceae bacterium]|nr:hypothetical protein [Planctomycetaceae bacterium]
MSVAISWLVLLALPYGCGGRPDSHANHGVKIQYTIDESVVRAVDRSILSENELELFTLIVENRLNELGSESLPTVMADATWSRATNSYLTNYDFDLRHAIPEDPFNDSLAHSFSMGIVVCGQCEKPVVGYVQARSF